MRFLALLLLLSALLPGPQARTAERCSPALVKAFYDQSVEDRVRLPRSYEIAKQIKNTPRERPLVVDLTNYCENGCSLLRTELKAAGTSPEQVRSTLTREIRRQILASGDTEILKRVDETRRTYPFVSEYMALHMENAFESIVQPALTEYDQRVLILQTGDTVAYGARRFRLGPFLGAGNRSHIFRLADTPDQVIRIPFLIKEHKKGFQHPEVGQRFYLGKEPAHVVNRSEVIEVGDGFVISRFINGTQNGLDFLEGLLRVYRIRNARLEIGMGTRIVFSPTSILKKIRDPKLVARVLDPDAHEKFQKLIKALEVAVKTYDNEELGLLYPFNVTRQFLWEPDTRDWFLVDFE